MNFNLKNSKIYKAIILEKIFPRKILYLFLILESLFSFIFLVSIFKNFINFNIVTLQKSIGFFIIFFDLLLITLIIYFFKNYLENPSIQIDLKTILKNENQKNFTNLADVLSFRAALVLYKSLKFKNKDLIVNAILIEILKIKRCKFIFKRLMLDIKDLIKYFKNYFYKIKKTKDISLYSFDHKIFKEIINSSIKIAIIQNHKLVDWNDLIYTCLCLSRFWKDIILYHNIKNDDLLRVILWEEMIFKQKQQRRKFWRLENLMRYEGIGKKWAYGYTIILDKFSYSVSEIFKEEERPYHLIGHEDKVFTIEQILSKSGGNNVLVMGEPGVGRKRVVLELAKHIKEGQTFKSLNYKRVLELDMISIISGVTNYAEFAQRLNRILYEAISAGNIVLIVDDFHNFIGPEKQFDITEIILPYLKMPNFQLVAITDYAGLHKVIEKNPALSNLFVKVEINEPSAKETILIVEQLLEFLEKKYGVFVPYQTIREIINASINIFLDVPFPKKAIDLLNELIVYVTTTTGEKIILPKYVSALVYKKTGIPLFEAKEIEREKLLNLENLLHKRIINQNEAIKSISNAMRRARANISTRKKPIGTFLFLGPTGVGKTETAKALTEIYFGNENKMIRLDMSEYQEINSIDRLIGSPIFNTEGEFSNKVRKDPFSLILLDEIEKAHKNILNLFLQVLDEGYLTDGFGRKVSFKNAIIIATSNAGAEFIREKIKTDIQDVQIKLIKNELIDFLLKEKIFRPEFLNRFDAVIAFQPLSLEHLEKITILMLNKLKNRLRKQGYNFLISPELIKKLAKLGFNPTFGAREIRRVIQDEVESKVAQNILERKYKKGDTISINI